MAHFLIFLGGFLRSAASHCKDCYWHEDSINLLTCFSANCKEELLLNTTLFASSYSTASKSCRSCKSLTNQEYFSCISTHCASLILESAKTVAATSPKVIHDRRPLKKATCDSCLQNTQNELYAFDCAFYNCRSSFFAKKSLNNEPSSLKCRTCNDLEDQAYLNCAYFYCRAEVENEMQELREDLKVYGCADRCYLELVYEGGSYKECVQYYCKVNTFNLPSIAYTSINVEESPCNKCRKYLGDEAINCIEKYCKEEIMAPDAIFSKQSLKYLTELSYCSDCRNFWTSGDYEDYYECTNWYCRTEISIAAFNYFAPNEVLDSKPINSESKCEGCVECYDIWDCILFYCKEEVVENQLAGETSLEERYFTYLYGNTKALSVKEVNKRFEYCNFVELGYYENDFKTYFCFKHQLLDRDSLFKGISDGKGEDLCEYCYTVTEEEYYICVYELCKQRILENSRELVLKSQDIPTTRSMSCERCLDFYDVSNKNSNFLCFFQNCKQEALRKEVLLHTNKNFVSPSCSSCLTYVDAMYLNCVYMYCKSEISNKVQNLFKHDVISLNPCTDSCYYDWYYYQYSYHTCVYEYCKSVVLQTKKLHMPTLPISLKSNSDTMHSCTEACEWYTDSMSAFNSCYNTNCANNFYEINAIQSHNSSAVEKLLNSKLDDRKHNFCQEKHCLLQYYEAVAAAILLALVCIIWWKNSFKTLPSVTVPEPYRILT